MKQKMPKISNRLKALLAYSVLLLVALSSIGPDELNFQLVIIVFGLIYIWLFMVCAYLVRVVFKEDVLPLTILWSLGLIVLLALSSLGQLGPSDVLISTLFVALATLYLNKRRKH